MELSNKNCSIVLDHGGRLAAVANLLTGERYEVADGAEYAVFDGAVTNEGIEVEWTDHGSYFEKTVTFTAQTDGVLEQLSVFDPTFAEAAEVHFHDDKTIWHVPMCVFARYAAGGVYYGLEYPYWDAEREMIFSPFVPLAKGEKFTAERVFLGTFKNDGRRVWSCGPYPCGGKQKYTDSFGKTNSGLAQHFAGGVVPDDVGIGREELDRGEVRAMKAFFAEHLGHYPLPEEGYFVWQNGWWAGLFNADTSVIDVLERAGVRDIMTASMYYGHANHPSCAPNYITDVRFDPLRFPKVDVPKPTDPSDGQGRAANGEPQNDTNGGAQTALHHEESVAEARADLEYTDDFNAPPEYDALVRYGRERGVHVASFSTPDNSYRAHPEWLARREDGEAYKYFGTPVSCPACREYMDRHLEMLSAVIARYEPRIWPFDGRWMGYREIACGEELGEQPCYAEGHGHVPGRSRYSEWKNIEDFKRRLKERFPGVVLEHYYGMKRGGTWSLKYCGSDENVYECASADDNRFQTWHNEVDRFRPTYLNYAPVFGREHDMEYSLISAISTSEYCQIAGAYDNLRDDVSAVATFRKWCEWAGENRRYLLEREDLFGCPGDVAIDGSAHIIDGEGWVFLFNTVDFDDVAHLVPGEIYGLSGGEYVARAIYPDERVIAAKDGVIDVPVASHTACVLWLGKK